MIFVRAWNLFKDDESVLTNLMFWFSLHTSVCFWYWIINWHILWPKMIFNIWKSYFSVLLYTENQKWGSILAQKNVKSLVFHLRFDSIATCTNMKMGPPRPGPTSCNNYIALESPTSTKWTNFGVPKFSNHLIVSWMFEWYRMR